MTTTEFDAAVDRDAAKHPPHPDDMVRWADGTECCLSELGEYLTFMSDDFERIPACALVDDCPY